MTAITSNLPHGEPKVLNRPTPSVETHDGPFEGRMFILDGRAARSKVAFSAAKELKEKFNSKKDK